MVLGSYGVSFFAKIIVGKISLNRWGPVDFIWDHCLYFDQKWPKKVTFSTVGSKKCLMVLFWSICWKSWLFWGFLVSFFQQGAQFGGLFLGFFLILMKSFGRTTCLGRAGRCRLALLCSPKNFSQSEKFLARFLVWWAKTSLRARFRCALRVGRSRNAVARELNRGEQARLCIRAAAELCHKGHRIPWHGTV